MGDPSDESSSSNQLHDKGRLGPSSSLSNDLEEKDKPPLNDSGTLADRLRHQDYFDLSPAKATPTYDDRHDRVRPASSPQILARNGSIVSYHADNAHTHDASSVDNKHGSGGRIGDKPAAANVASTKDPMSQSEKFTTMNSDSSEGNTITVGSSSEEKPNATTTPSPAKGPMGTRMKEGAIRFLKHTKDALFRTYFNVLLLFVPAGIVAKAVGLSPAVVFSLNAIAVIPLAGLLTHATESVASRLGDTLGALLNVSFGNAVELIIFIIALVKDEIRIVQASLLGSILANLLLILGMAFLFGGLRYREQIYNSTVTQMSACLLSLSVMSLLLPTAFHASFSDVTQADLSTLKISRGTSVVLLLIYVLYLLFQLKSHAYLYESMPQAQIDAEALPGPLAEMLDSSTSSGSSSSSSSDTDSSSGSHTTAKRRIKKFIRRTRRKSSSTSHEVGSAPSDLGGSPVHEGAFDLDNSSHAVSSVPASVKAISRRGSHTALDDIASGDEGDGEAGRKKRGVYATRVRDFEPAQASLSPERLKALARKERKHRKHRRHGKARSLFSRGDKDNALQEIDEKAGSSQSNTATTTTAAADSQAKPAVNFAPINTGSAPADDIMGELMIKSDSQPGRRPFGLRQISTVAKPDIKRFMTQNVFVTAPPPLPPNQSHFGVRMPINGANVAAAANASIMRPSMQSTNTNILHRTNSLPDRLNHRRNTANHKEELSQQQSANAIRRPLPPYVMRVPPETVMAIDQEGDLIPAPEMSRTSAIVMLLVSTALVAICAEFLVDAIPAMIADSPSVSQAFIGLIILPIVGNAAEHVTAVTVATKNKMDLAIGVAVGSSIQIALFVTPLIVILGWIMDKNMTLYFNLFETVSLFVTVFVVNFLVLDGKSNYLEGALLIAAYVIIAVASFFYPDQQGQSALGGSDLQSRSAPLMAMVRGLF